VIQQEGDSTTQLAFRQHLLAIQRPGVGDGMRIPSLKSQQTAGDPNEY
jgi:hypothetical protein